MKDIFCRSSGDLDKAAALIKTAADDLAEAVEVHGVCLCDRLGV